MKRTLFITLAGMLIASAATAQHKTLSEFTAAYYDVASTARLGFGILPFRMVSWLIPNRAFDGEMKNIRWALKKVKRVRFYAIDMDGGEISPESIADLKAELASKDKYEPLAELRHGKSDIHLLSKSRREDKIENLIVLLKDEDVMVMLHLRTKLTMDDISRIIRKIGDADAPLAAN